MATFAYTAVDASGRRTSGTVPAESRAAAIDAVVGRGLSPVELREQGGNGKAAAAATPPKSTKVSARAVENFTRELANLLAAGLPLSRALALLKREASNPAARHVWTKIHDDVTGGEPLADALAKFPQAFGTVYVAMVRAGEAGGFLPVVLQQIADFRQREKDLTGKVKSAMIYPVALATVAAGVLVFLMTFFIPKFGGIFEQFGERLPLLTRVVVAISGWLIAYGPFLLIGMIVVAIVARRWSATDSGRRTIDRAILATPALNVVVARFALVRFARMLGTLVQSGVPLVASLRVARQSLGNATFADAVGQAIDEVQRGTPLSRALSAEPRLFPAGVVETLSVAEETGRLDAELLRISTSYEGDLDRNLRMLVSLAEPLLLIVMAALIGTVVVSMLLPVFTLQDMIQ